MKNIIIPFSHKMETRPISCDMFIWREMMDLFVSDTFY